MFEIKIALINLKNDQNQKKALIISNLDQLSFCDWRKRSAPNLHQSIPLFMKGVVLAFRVGGGMFKEPMVAEYIFM